ncbi:MAG: DUF4221 domain-containing protein [Bacteroidaceae bacterium]|nr:DUF4221 domain-containing protein [Bacteroidaceae bacterium]
MKFLSFFYCVISALSFLLCGCSGQEGKSSQHIGLVQTTDTLSFPLPDGFKMFSDYIFLYTDSASHEYLLYRDRPKNPQILVYDVECPSDNPTVIKFQREGPNGVGAQTVGFFMRSWDEIYIPNTVLEICVIDSSGILNRKIILGDENTPRENALWTSSNSSHPFIFVNDKMYCYQNVNKFKGEKEVTESPVDLIVNLKDGTFVPSPLCYPSDLVVPAELCKKAGLNVHAHRCLSNDKIVYSFWFSHTLYEYDVNTGAIRKAVAKSRYLPDEKALSPFNRLNNRQTDGFDEACEMPYYRHIYYDKYRRVFYRFAYPPNKNDIKLNFVDYLFVGRNTASIMVLDEDLNVLSETLLPENCFNTSTTFINKDGLWISCNHMLNPGLDEDHLQFVRFELKTEN